MPDHALEDPVHRPLPVSRRADEALVFLHVPKAAGTTLHLILADNYRAEETFHVGADAPSRVEDFARLPLAQRACYRLVKGHLMFGIHEFMPRPTRYITVLRQPVERAISHYYYVLRRPSHRLHDYARSVPLREYVQTQVGLDNGQVRMISGVGWTVPHGRCTSATLEQARRNLDRSFAAVGIAEKFDESVLLFQRVLGWKPPFYSRQNVTENRAQCDTLPGPDLEAVRRTNELDASLYDYACGLLERAIQSQPGSFPADLACFRQANERAQQAKSLRGRLDLYRRGRVPWIFWPGAWRARIRLKALAKPPPGENCT